jgi:hypothetical protein
MAYGVWVTDEQDTLLMDADGKKINMTEARRRAGDVLSKKEPPELIAMLLDRLDSNDLMELIADVNHKFRSES